MKGKSQLKEGAALPQKRLFGGEGWKPIDFNAARQICKGVPINRSWDKYDIPSNSFYSHSPIPIQDGEEFAGIERGSTVVIGYYGNISERRYWVTKCQCGVFELISEKTLRKKPHSPQHCCAVCRLAEAQRYQHECCELAECNGLDFEAMRTAYKARRGNQGKRNSFGLIHFIRQQIKVRAQIKGMNNSRSTNPPSR